MFVLRGIAVSLTFFVLLYCLLSLLVVCGWRYLKSLRSTAAHRLASLLFWSLTASPARAHFLFIHIGPFAEAGRAAEVYFSELAEAGDPRRAMERARRQEKQIPAERTERASWHKARNAQTDEGADATKGRRRDAS